MSKRLLIAVVAATCCTLHVEAQDAKAVLDAAAQTMGATSLQSVQYTGAGSTYGFGQAIGPGQPWPRFTMTKYVAAVNYASSAMREEIVRIDDENPPRGGGAGPYNPTTHQGGIRPIPFGPQTQIRQTTGRTEGGRIQLAMMTPHGFLKAATENSATVSTLTGGRGHAVAFMIGRSTLTGTINNQGVVERVETRLYNNVLGDMPVEVVYSDFRDFAGVKFPMRIVQRQGGFPTLDVRVAAVQPNGAATLEIPAPPQAGGGPAQPQRVEAQRIADGFWFLSAGAPMSYLIEFSDHAAVVEAPGNDARTEAVLAEVRRVLPNKPVRYVINTHHHSDHAGGLRGFAAEGITIITHELNKPYYERIFKNPHSLNPDRLARSNRTPVIEAVRDRRVLSDGVRTVEIHHIRGNLHDPALLMVYLPKEKMLIQADAYNPRPPEARPLPGPSPFTINLLENIQRLKLDVEQIVHVHGGVEPFAALLRAAGRQGTSQ